MAPEPTGGIPLTLWRGLALIRRKAWRVADRMTPWAARPGAWLDQREAEIIARIRQRGGPIRVGFVVSEPAKWSSDSLFRLLAESDAFSPGFHCVLSDVGMRRGPAGRRRAIGQAHRFFGAIGPLWSDLYDPASNRMRWTRSIDADLVFIQQPWGLQELPRRLAGRSLTAYLHYGFPVIENARMQYGLPDFHPWLWRHFVPSQLHAEEISAAAAPKSRNPFASGYPKLDGYHSPAPARDAVALWRHPQETGRKRVIFAPHHAFGAKSLGLATFEWSGAAMLDIVRENPEVDFVIRAHPNIMHAMVQGGTASHWQRFFNTWRSLPNTSQSVNDAYLDLFRTSDAMITDSGAFLAEYLPTDRPLIRLVRPEAAGLNLVGKRLAEAHYPAPDAATLRALFEDVVLRGNDPRRAAREAVRPLILPFDRPAAEIIRDHLLETLLGATPAG